jgi:hypothetical protein
MISRKRLQWRDALPAGQTQKPARSDPRRAFSCLQRIANDRACGARLKGNPWLPLKRYHAAMRWKDPATQAALAELSAAGISAAQIADAMGESRAAVNSAMHRYGLHADPRPRQSRAAADNSAMSLRRKA